MSHIIKDLGLAAEPVYVQRLGNCNVSAWRAVCDCGYTSEVFPRIGLALEQMTFHAEIKRLQRFEEVA